MAMLGRFTAFRRREDEKRDEEARQLAERMAQNAEYVETMYPMGPLKILRGDADAA